MLLSRFEITKRIIRGACFEVNFAAFCAWRAWGFPDRHVHNVFAAAALHSADGAYLLGEMAAATANAGRLYFPCGTPERADLAADGRLDLEGSVARELKEETGVDLAGLEVEPGWTMVRDGCSLALIKSVAVPLAADALRTRILRHIAGEDRPELAGLRLVRSPGDFVPAMPAFVKAYLAHIWS